MSAANGDVQNCRLILEKERFLKMKKGLSEESAVAFTQSFTVGSQNFVHTLADGENILTNFVSSGHSSLQAAAQNGHIEVCRVLITEFGADVEFQVQNYLSCRIEVVRILIISVQWHSVIKRLRTPALQGTRKGVTFWNFHNVISFIHRAFGIPLYGTRVHQCVTY